jgi:O-antigen/teichoic acid export membrane protein
MLMGVVASLRWPVNLYTGGLMGLQRQVLLNALNAGIATIQGGGAVLVLWLVSPTIQAFFIWQIVAAVVQITLLSICLWYSIPAPSHKPSFSRQSLKNIWRFAVGVTGISMASVILTQLDKFLLSKLLPLETFGYYALAVTIAGDICRFLSRFFKFDCGK